VLEIKLKSKHENMKDMAVGHHVSRTRKLDFTMTENQQLVKGKKGLRHLVY